ncbi:hypothetical protein H0H87_012779 [Tephrocybe sp. NHM501043]|nr:hypothetical protein H0H87_012779 [Tephrocybe sp. NHM501043]
MGWVESLPFLRYGKSFQVHRRMFQQHFNKTASANYHPVQLRQSRILAQKLVSGGGVNVQETEDAINTYVAESAYVTAVIVRIVAGYHVTSAEDPYIKLAHEVCIALANSGSGGGSILDFIPAVAYLPRWFPGTHYAYHARDNLPKVQALYEFTFDDVQSKMASQGSGGASGTVESSIMATQLAALQEARNSDSEGVGYTSDDVKGAGATAYIAGAETVA